jgi:hypothetical protein
MTSLFLQKKSITLKMIFFFFDKKYEPSDEIKLRDEITAFYGISLIYASHFIIFEV